MRRPPRLALPLSLLLAACGSPHQQGDGGPPDLAAASDLASPGDLPRPTDLALPDLRPPLDLARPDAALAPGRCRTTSDCKPGQTCLRPGELGGCGICMKPPDPCQDDAPCRAQGPTWICEPGLCTCNGETVCKPGCGGNQDCPPWQSCAPSHRCLDKVCRRDDECPASFICTPPNNPHCQRKPCATDGECPAYCVGGLCYPEFGTCEYPRP